MGAGVIIHVRPDVRVHGPNVQTRAMRGRTMDEWTIAIRDGRAPRVPGGPETLWTVPTVATHIRAWA